MAGNQATLSIEPRSVLSSLASDCEVIGPRSIPAVGSADERMWAALKSLQGDEVVCCSAARLGDSELRLTMPARSSVAVGQRYEVALMEHQLQSADMDFDGQYATVVRTLEVPGQSGKTLSVGLRFDHPMMF